MLWFESSGRAPSRGFRLAVVESPDRAAPLVGALDAAEVGAWAWVEAEGTLYWSPQVPEILGVTSSVDDAPREAFLARVHPEDRAGLVPPRPRSTHRSPRWASAAYWQSGRRRICGPAASMRSGWTR